MARRGEIPPASCLIWTNSSDSNQLARINFEDTLKPAVLGGLHTQGECKLWVYIYCQLTHTHNNQQQWHLLSFGTNFMSLLFTFTGTGSTRHFPGGALLWKKGHIGRTINSFPVASWAFASHCFSMNVMLTGKKNLFKWSKKSLTVENIIKQSHISIDQSPNIHKSMESSGCVFTCHCWIH